MKFYTLLLLSLFIFPRQGYSQNCWTISGKVVDADSHKELPLANIYIIELSKGTTATQKGTYSITDLCGTITAVYSFTGYKSDTIKITLTQNSIQDVYLEQATVELHEAIIHGDRVDATHMVSQTASSITGNELVKAQGLSLGEALKTIPGVYSLQTGPTISKPVIHGLYNNRVLILNNGVRQEGQQWGNEHAPEIDPFTAGKLSVIKGAASIRFGADAIGGVVLVEPAPLRKESGIGGALSLVGASNSRLLAGSGMIEGAFDKKLNGLRWRLQGTLKKSGNSKSSDYYLDNTGSSEKDYSATLGYVKNNVETEIYMSHYETKIGIFSGSDTETAEDLQAAIDRTKPNTPSYFTYSINRPYQLVSHNLLKVKTAINLEKSGKLEVTLARQHNERSEFGLDAINGLDNPELLLKITTHTADIIFNHKPTERFSGSLGVSGLQQSNNHFYELLIPDYQNLGAGVFMIERWTKNKLTVEGGLRYDYRWLQAFNVDYSGSFRDPIYNFSNATGTVGLAYEATEQLTFRLNAGTAWRPPTASELFSEGVHQSAASYELGNKNLAIEQSFNLSVTSHYHSNNFFMDVEVYQNTINNFIYLKPDLTLVETDRGSFASFTYTPADVVFRGADLNVGIKLLKGLQATSKASLLWAYNNSANDYLIFTPPNRLENSLRYDWNPTKEIHGLYIELTNTEVAKQNRVPLNSDYTAPPEGYILFGFNTGVTVHINHKPVTISFGGSNIFNRSYRDYMNRFRYFTNDVGSNYTLRLKVPF